jgi:hypothetical protein
VTVQVPPSDTKHRNVLTNILEPDHLEPTAVASGELKNILMRDSSRDPCLEAADLEDPADSGLWVAELKGPAISRSVDCAGRRAPRCRTSRGSSGRSGRRSRQLRWSRGRAQEVASTQVDLANRADHGSPTAELMMAQPRARVPRTDHHSPLPCQSWTRRDARGRSRSGTRCQHGHSHHRRLQLRSLRDEAPADAGTASLRRADGEELLLDAPTNGLGVRRFPSCSSRNRGASSRLI